MKDSWRNIFRFFREIPEETFEATSAGNSVIIPKSWIYSWINHSNILTGQNIVDNEISRNDNAYVRTYYAFRWGTTNIRKTPVRIPAETLGNFSVNRLK